ncbi:MAG: alkanesulfonate monooxygenase, partial [Gemmatimonadota bacterium]
RYGVSGYVVVRETEEGVRRELARITSVEVTDASGYHSFQDWLDGTDLERELSEEEYAVSNRGLKSGLVGTPGQVVRRIDAFEEAGADLLLLQFSPQLPEMERFARTVMPLRSEREAEEEPAT